MFKNTLPEVMYRRNDLLVKSTNVKHTSKKLETFQIYFGNLSIQFNLVSVQYKLLFE